MINGACLLSKQIEYQGKTAQHLLTNINQYVSFKKMTEMSLDKLENDGLVNCYYPDNATSWSYNYYINIFINLIYHNYIFHHIVMANYLNLISKILNNF